MIDYRVRSISLLNLVNDIGAGRLVPDAYFQRNLVWRDVHKKDFINTILLGLPFPQIFISKGKVDVEEMRTISCIVDGQQRTNAIIGFIGDEFDVDEIHFSDLSDNQKSAFLKYEIAVIELDLENDDPKVQEIFQRINRTSNSLTIIEKLASEYATSSYMLVAKLLADQIDLNRGENEDFREDPNIPEDFFSWAKQKKVKRFIRLMTQKGIFTQREIAKKVHLMHVLNIMSTCIGGFFNRNEKTNEYLDDYSESFDERNQILKNLEKAAYIILKMNLNKKSYWYNKANVFSLIVAVIRCGDEDIVLNPETLKTNLLDFEENLPDDYRLAAKEGVNSTQARVLRDNYLKRIVRESV